MVKLAGISHVAINVSDLERARAFYCDIIGFEEEGVDLLDGCGKHLVLRTATGQRLALCLHGGLAPSPETGVHQAYAVTPTQRDDIAARLARHDHELKRYVEFRAAEQADNFYVADPDGNRLQLVAAESAALAAGGGVIGINHAAVQAMDVEWAEKFYVGDLGLAVDSLVGWQTGEYVRARKWKNGEEDVAPGVCRVDKVYRMVEKKHVDVPRVNLQFYVRTGDEVFGVYLADRHHKHPPEEQIVGLPRTAFRVGDAELPQIAKVLRDHGWPVEGPIEQPQGSPIARSLYSKDPGGNFIEFCCWNHK